MALAYADDGYIKAKMSVTLQVLADLQHVLQEDAGVDLNVSKTSFHAKGVSQQTAFDVAHTIITNSPTLTSLSGKRLPCIFLSRWFRRMGVPNGPDAFVQRFVAKTCTSIIDDAIPTSCTL